MYPRHAYLHVGIIRSSAIADEPRDALRQLNYYGRFLTELLTRSSANLEEPCDRQTDGRTDRQTDRQTYDES